MVSAGVQSGASHGSNRVPIRAFGSSRGNSESEVQSTRDEVDFGGALSDSGWRGYSYGDFNISLGGTAVGKRGSSSARPVGEPG